MSPTADQSLDTPAPRRIPRGWIVFGLALAALACFGWLDARKRQEAPSQGYCPASARWVVLADDFSALWGATAKTDAVARLREEWPRPLDNLELAIRKATGIRPTPSRWRLWMGNRFLLGGAPEGTGICVYPGLLTRAADLVHRLVAPSRAQGAGIRRFGELYYAWKDGFLIASRSREYVVACFEGPHPELGASTGNDEIRILWRGTREGEFRIRAANELPVEARIRTSITPRSRPLTLPGAWPEPPVLSIAASKWRDLHSLLAFVEEPFQENQTWRRAKRVAETMWERWGLTPLDANWDAAVDECAIAVTSMDWSETLSAPDVAMVLRCEDPVAGGHPLGPLFEPSEPIPYEWRREPGVLAPLFGEEAAICLSRSGRDWLVTSREPLMDALTGALNAGQKADADLALRLRWDIIGESAYYLIQAMSEAELVPHRNRGDVAVDLLPIALGLGRLGRAELDGKAEGAWLVLEGILAGPFEPAWDDAGQDDWENAE